jgi:hypothetical protein
MKYMYIKCFASEAAFGEAFSTILSLGPLLDLLFTTFIWGKGACVSFAFPLPRLPQKRLFIQHEC